MEWQTIETAPKDGQRIIVISDRGIVSIEQSDFIFKMILAAIEDREPNYYTHWMPLPKAPNAELRCAL